MSRPRWPPLHYGTQSGVVIMPDKSPNMAAAYRMGWSDEQIDEFKQAFYSFDEDGEGTIGRSELGDLLEALGENLTANEVDEMMAEVDEDGSGQIDFDEFLGMMISKMSDDQLEKDIMDSFALLDKDGSGLISGVLQFLLSVSQADELKHVVTDFCGKLTDPEVNDLLSEADITGDGLLSYEEFYKIMMFDKIIMSEKKATKDAED